jgi:hypothetical protein
MIEGTSFATEAQATSDPVFGLQPSKPKDFVIFLNLVMLIMAIKVLIRFYLKVSGPFLRYYKGFMSLIEFLIFHL